MPTERILVGGGTSYTPNVSDLSQYYNFNYGNSTIDTYVNGVRTDGFNKNTKYHLYKSINSFPKLFSNKLFTGILPYQSILDSGFICYYRINNNNGQSLMPQIPILMNFNLPVVVTKYRLWNGFVSRSYSILGSDPSENTPQDWNMQGSNDSINWTTIDTRVNQNNFPYAVSRLAKNSPYVEYSISSPAAYKIYRLNITKGGRSGAVSICNKAGCTYYFNNFQIGEIQLLGYEDPTVSCSLHGYDSIFPGVSYPGTDITKRHNFSQAFKLDNNDFDSVWGNNDSNAYVHSSLPSGIIDFGTNITVKSYNINIYSYNPYYLGSATGLKVYGSYDNINWILLDTKSSIFTRNTWVFCNISSPGSYRYYKFSVTSSNACDKSGCASYIKDIQIVGTIG